MQVLVWRRFLPAILVVGVALAASVTGLRNDYAQDDVPLVFEDPRVHTFDLKEIFTSSYWPPPFHQDLYRPLASISFAVQWAVGDGSPVVFRIVSYLLYAAVSLAMLALARGLLPAGIALGAALVFAAHPVHVEAVALAVNQGEQWVGLLSLIAVLTYLRRRRTGWLVTRDWVQLAILYLVACLFKEHAVVMPGLLIMAELTVVSTGSMAERLRRLRVGFAGLAVVGASFLALRTAIIGDFVGSFTAEGLDGQGRWGRLLTMLQVVPEWLRLLIWPAHLQGDYSPRVIEQAVTWGTPQTVGAAIVVGLALIGWLLRRMAPTATFGLLWVAVALLPVSNILVATGIVMAERTLYLPSIGFLLAVAGVMAILLQPAGAPARTGLARVAAVVTVLLVAAGVVRSAIRHLDWRSQVYYWAKTVQDAPLSYRAHHAHAQLLYGLGYEGAAVSAFHTAFALYPKAWWIKNELGNRFRLRAQCYPAIDLYRESIQVFPEQTGARASLIACLLHLGRYQEAIQEAEAGMALQAAGTAIYDANAIQLSEFTRFRAVADSALRVGAPAGSVQIQVTPAREKQ